MSQLDSELDRLRLRMVALEEQKRKEAEVESEKKSFPLKTLEEVIVNSKNCVSGFGKLGSSQRENYMNSMRELSFLEPILYALKNINERLDALEKKN